MITISSSGAGCGGLGLSQQQVVLSNAMSVSGTILVRIAIGAIADQVGVRWSYILLLIFVSIPGFCMAGKKTCHRFGTFQQSGPLIEVQVLDQIRYKGNFCVYQV
jgi:nitrate/nitrite transporter NarK